MSEIVISRWIVLGGEQHPQSTAATPQVSASNYSSGEVAAPEVVMAQEDSTPPINDKSPIAVSRRVIARHRKALDLLGAM